MTTAVTQADFTFALDLLGWRHRADLHMPSALVDNLRAHEVALKASAYRATAEAKKQDEIDRLREREALLEDMLRKACNELDHNFEPQASVVREIHAAINGETV